MDEIIKKNSSRSEHRERLKPQYFSMFKSLSPVCYLNISIVLWILLLKLKKMVTQLIKNLFNPLKFYFLATHKSLTLHSSGWEWEHQKQTNNRNTNMMLSCILPFVRATKLWWSHVTLEYITKTISMKLLEWLHSWAKNEWWRHINYNNPN